PGGALFTCAAACGGTASGPTIAAHDTIVTDTDSTATPVVKPCDTHLGGSITGGTGSIEWPGTTCTAFAAHADPMLAAIALNGGPTSNYRLLPNSPAIDL